MGWNTSALFVRGRSIDDVVHSLPDVVVWVPGDERVVAEFAYHGSPGGRVYLAENGGWCQMWDPDQKLPVNVDRWLTMDVLGTIRGTQALAVAFSSVMSIYALWFYDDAELVRHVWFEGGEATTEIGGPLPSESGAEIPSWGPDEDFLWHVIHGVTGLKAFPDQLFSVYEAVED